MPSESKSPESRGMRLTLEEHPETIRRYAHVRPASRWGSVRCGARLPGASRVCSMERGHRGPHVAHGFLNRVVAVWDAGARSARPPKPVKRTVRVTGRGALGSGGPWAGLRAFGRRLAARPEHAMEQVLLLGFGIGMLVFVLDWVLRILGVR